MLSASGRFDYTEGVIPLRSASPPRMTRTIGLVLLVAGIVAVGAQTSEEDRETIFLTGGVSIRTTPIGVEVFLDGRPVGTTPLELSDIRPGRHRLRLEYRGYRSVDRWITVPAGSGVSVEETLLPELRTVIITGAPSAAPIEIYLNGEWVASNLVRLRPGRHTLQVRAFGFAGTTIEVEVPTFSAQSIPDEPIPIEVALDEITNPTESVSLQNRPIRPTSSPRVVNLALSVTTDAPERITVVVQALDANEIFRTTVIPRVRTSEVVIGPFEIPDRNGTFAPVRVLVFNGSTPKGAPVFDAIVPPPATRRGVADPLYRSGYGTSLFPTPATGERPRITAVLGGGLLTNDLSRETSLFLPGFLRLGWRPWGRGSLSAGGRIRPGSDTEEPQGDFSASLGGEGAVSDRVRLAINVAGRVDDTFGGDRVTVVGSTGSVMYSTGVFDTVLAAGVEREIERTLTRPTVGAALRYHSRGGSAALSAKVFVTDRDNEDLPTEQFALDVQTPIGGEVFLQGNVGISRFPSRFDISVELGIGYSIIPAPQRD